MSMAVKKIYIFLRKSPEVILFSLRFLKVCFQRSDVKFEKKNLESINILGNGPSAHVTYQENKNVKEKLMCVNFFALTKEFLEYKPEYYSFIDPEIFMNLNDKNISLMKAIESIDWRMRLFIPYEYKNIIEGQISNDNIEFNYIRDNYFAGKNRMLYELYLRNLATPKFQNILVACIYVALNKGFSTIKLHGVEANEFKNYTVNVDNEVFLETQHFYGSSIINMTKEGRIKKGEFWKYLNYYSCMLKGFSQVEGYSKYLGSKIYNYTKGSYIDSFEKK